MTGTPFPVWPVLVLAGITLADAILCLGPVSPIARCFDAVGFPRRYWSIIPVIKFSAVAGLIAGVSIPGLGFLTACALIGYFVLAVAAHVRAWDFGRNLFVNATGMLALCIAVTVISF